MLAIAGAADTFTVVFRGTIVQQTTPEEFRGRVTAADYVVGASGGQLGNLEAGALGSLTSPVISALSGGLITIAGAVVIGLTLPAFTRYRARRSRGCLTNESGAVLVLMGTEPLSLVPGLRGWGARCAGRAWGPAPGVPAGPGS